ncbi:MAG: hypothetical protein AB1650_04235 [Candidatus Omnitrophota bacterium]
MKVNRFFIMAGMMALSVTGCTHLIMARQQEAGRWSRGGISAVLPPDWDKTAFPRSILCLSRTGEKLQRIVLQRKSSNYKFPRAKRRLSADMLPQEAAQLVIDNLSLNRKLGHFNVVRNKPYPVSKDHGFLIEYTYRDEHFVPRRSLLIGVLNDRYYYEIKYQAVDQFYYQDGIGEFMTFLKTVNLS